MRAVRSYRQYQNTRQNTTHTESLKHSQKHTKTRAVSKITETGPQPYTDDVSETPHLALGFRCLSSRRHLISRLECSPHRLIISQESRLEASEHCARSRSRTEAHTNPEPSAQCDNTEISPRTVNAKISVDVTSVKQCARTPIPLRTHGSLHAFPSKQ